MSDINYKRILLKISGELLSSGTGTYDFLKIKSLSDNIKKIVDDGIELSIVVGGGNIFRGRNGKPHGFDNFASDHIGMSATIVNSLLLSQMLKTCEVENSVFCSYEVGNGQVHKYDRGECLKVMSEKQVVIFCGGLGVTCMTTDSAAVIRAIELKCEVLLKATKVDGIYDKDPNKFPDSKKIGSISYDDFLAKKLEIMDANSICLASEKNLPIIVFSAENMSNIYNILDNKVNHSQIRRQK